MTIKKKSRPAKGRQSKSARSRQSKATKKKPTRKPTSRQLMLADLARSGLTARDAKRAGYKPLTEDEVFERTGYRRVGYLIPYFDIDGKPTSYWRVRFTTDPAVKFLP
jgi:hypothetical protein